MSIAPPPPVYPTWPPAPYPPTAPVRRRRWPALTAAAIAGALIAGAITTGITMAATAPEPAPARNSDTAAAAPAPAAPALTADEADKQTCHAWGTASGLSTAAAATQGIIPQGMTITDPAVQSNPLWKDGVLKASGYYGQAADTLESQALPGTPMLTQMTGTAVSALRTLSESFKAFDPANGNSMAVFQKTQQAMDWLCR